MPDLAAAAETFRLFVRDGHVTEVRALDAIAPGDRRLGTYSGYFNKAESFARAVGDIRAAKGIYFTPNPVNPALLARAANRIKRVDRGACTQDHDILSRCYLLIDADPIRPSGISSTDEEHQAAIARVGDIRVHLNARGWPEPVVADSGNGAHLIYAVELPVDDGGIVERCLVALSVRFDDGVVKIDQTVFNSARIWKVYGTMACKGDSTPERPHRMSRILSRPDRLMPVPRELLEDLAAEATVSKALSTGHRHRPDLSALDVDGFLRRHNLEAEGPEPWTGKAGETGRRWVLPVCPWNPAHDNRAAFIIQFQNGAISAGCLHDGCKGKGWHDLRAKYEPNGGREPSSTSGSPTSTLSAASSIVWRDLKPLPSELPFVQPYESSMLPMVLRRFVDDIAERMQCPPDFVAVAVVVVLGSVIGRRVGIRPKRQDDWLVVANLWGAVIGRPSLLKTPAIKGPLTLLQRLEAEARERYDAAMIKFEEQALVAKARKKDLESRLQKAVAKEKENGKEKGKEKDEEKDEVSSVLSALKKCASVEPIRERFLTNDATVEKLGEILAQNLMGVMVFRDELVGWLHGLEKENQQGARAFYLEAWSGTGRFTYDRIGRGTIDIESATVSVFGGIQPGRLGPYVRHAVSGGVGDDGLIQRFQVIVWPDAGGTWRNVDRWPDAQARDAVFEVLRRLKDVTAESVGAALDANEKVPIPYLRFDDDGQEAFNEWRSELETRLRSGQEHPALESHLGKYRSLVPALALIFHLVETGSGPVAEAAVTLAVRWARYLESHARRVYNASTAAEIHAAKAIVARISRGDLRSGFDARTVYRKGWTGLDDHEVVKAALGLLVEHGHLVEWLDSQPSPQGGRPRHPIYLVNPAFREESPSEPTDRTDKASSVGSVGGVLGDRDAYEERLAICAVDGGLSEEEAEAIARLEAAGWLSPTPGGQP